MNAQPQHDDDLDLSAGGGERPTFVTGNYVVRCNAMSDAGKSSFPQKDQDGNPKKNSKGEIIFPEQWKWEHLIEDVEAKRPTPEQRGMIGTVVFRWTTKSLNENSNTFKYIDAFIGGTLDPNDKPMRSWVLGRRAVANLIAKDGKITSYTLTPYAYEDDDAEIEDDGEYIRDGSPFNPVEQMAAVASGDNRDKIMAELYEVEDRRDLAPIITRMTALGLGDDEEVNQVYELTFSRLGGSGKPAKTKTDSRQPVLS